MRAYLLEVCAALTQCLNALLGGFADETLSARAWRRSFYSLRWEMARSFIDALFFWQPNHCERAYNKRRRRQRKRPELRERSALKAHGE